MKNTLKTKVKNGITSDKTKSTFFKRLYFGDWIEPDNDNSHRLSVLFHNFSIIAILIFLIFLLFTFINNRIDLFFINLIGAFVVFLNMFFLRIIKSLNLVLIIGLISGALIVIFIIIFDQYKPSPYFWPLFYVIIPFFIMGHKKGLLFNFPFTLTVIYLAFSANNKLIDSFNNYNFAIRFTASLLGIMLLTYFFERFRFNAHNKMAEEIKKRKNIGKQLTEINKELVASIEKVKVLSGFLPICSLCKKIRDDKGYWNQIEEYISKHSNLEFSHGLCEKCAEKLYSEQEWFKDMKNKNIS